MFTSKNSFGVFIGKNISRTGSVQVTDKDLASYLADGEVVAIDADGNVLAAGDTVADSPFIKLAQRSGDTLSVSPKIVGSNVTAYAGASFAAATEQVTYVGFNGTSGAIEGIAQNLYSLRVVFTHDAELWSEQSNTIYNEFLSDGTGAAADVAAGFAKKFNATFPAQNEDITVERVSDGTFTALSNDAVVSAGSPTVTSTAHGLSAGDAVRIGGTAATDPVYLVASVTDANTFVLDTGYQGASATVLAANVGAMTVITWGLKITGNALPFTVAREKYTKVSFETTLKDFGATTVSNASVASKGIGEGEAVAELEYFALGFDGFLDTRNATPNEPQARTDASTSANYDIITIKAFDSTDYGAVSGVKPSLFEINIAVVEGAGQATNLLAELNPWFASTPGAFVAVSL